MKRVGFFVVILLLLFVACADENGAQHLKKGTEHFNEKRYEEAKEALKRALSKQLPDRSRRTAASLLGETYEALNDYDSAEIYYKKSLEIDSTYVQGYVNLGIIYRLTSKYEQAEESYRKALKLKPNNGEALASLGVLYLVQGENDLAIENLKRSVEVDAQLAVAHANYALALATVGDYDQAEAELKRALTLGYTSGTMLMERIQALKKLH